MKFKRTVFLSILFVPLLISSGCAAFRAEAGFGLGIGASVKLGGIFAGGAETRLTGKCVGNRYGEWASDENEWLTAGDSGYLQISSPFYHIDGFGEYIGIMPGILYGGEEGSETELHAWDFEFSVSLGLFYFVIGISPGKALGWDKKHPPSNTKENW